MQHALEEFIGGLPGVALFGLIAFCLAVLGKAADWLVKEAVALSERWGVPKIVIGATIVSLGTTTPEAAVSVLAAIQDDPSLALGNAVGSIICDTGLILGLACVISPPPLPANIVNRQGWVQLASGFLLIGVCFPWTDPRQALATGGTMPQAAGFACLGLLAMYLWLSAKWSRREKEHGELEDLEVDVDAPLPFILARFVLAIALVVIFSHMLIPAVQEAAVRVQIPQAVIAATLVAFGTSLPELVTALTAVRHGHGDLAVGNIVGADILNVLFVAGAASAVTPEGLLASKEFFTILFPAMAGVLIVFRIGIFVAGERLPRIFGVVLLACYVAATVASYSVTRT
jgi:cation:H+ antiporter